MSMGGSQRGVRAPPRRKKRRSRRCASSMSSQASAHIQACGLRLAITSNPVDTAWPGSWVRMPICKNLRVVTHNRFDEHFYRRFYTEQRTRVTTRAEMSGRARAVATLVRHLDLALPVRRILDAGCGLGWMRRALLTAFPGAPYVGLELTHHVFA